MTWMCPLCKRTNHNAPADFVRCPRCVSLFRVSAGETTEIPDTFPRVYVAGLPVLRLVTR